MTKNDTLSQLTAIIGPTASGKTETGIRLAQKVKGYVVSADSRQVYTGMDIGTAKPVKTEDNNSAKFQTKNDTDPTEIENIKHYLINIRNPDTPLSLSEWQKLAFAIIDDKPGHPILVGGTMLYVDSIINNYQIPPAPENKTIRQKLERQNTTELYEQLLKLDPQSQEFIQPANKRRIIRALEVIKTTGKPFSELRSKKPPRYNTKTIGIFPGWQELNQKIETRNKKMLDEGLIEETKKLRRLYGKQLPFLQTMNYKQATEIIDNKISAPEALLKMNQASKRYAHRQMSWWKNRPEITWIQSPAQITEIQNST